MDKKFIKAIIHATHQVFQSMVGWDVQAKELTLGERTNGNEDFSALISYNGEISGAVILAQTTELAGKIAAKMLDMETNEDMEATKDAIGELLNMIISVAKVTYNPEKDPFGISIPTIIIGKDYRIHLKADELDKISWLRFQINGGEEQVSLRILQKN